MVIKIAAQLSTIETQLIKTIFTPKFAMVAELQKPTPRISRWGPAQLEVVSAQLSTIEAQLITGGLASKITMGGASVSPAPTPYLRLGVSTIENSYSTIEHNWSTIE